MLIKKGFAILSLQPLNLHTISSIKEVIIMQHMPQKRTVRDILKYIQMKNKEGLLQESMMKMAESTGYSNATIHRSLRALEDEGYIKIIPTKSQRHPNKIFYIGPTQDNISQVMQKAQHAIDDLQKATEQVQSIMAELQDMMGMLQQQDSEYIQLH